MKNLKKASPEEAKRRSRALARAAEDDNIQTILAGTLEDLGPERLKKALTRYASALRRARPKAKRGKPLVMTGKSLRRAAAWLMVTRAMEIYPDASCADAVRIVSLSWLWAHAGPAAVDWRREELKSQKKGGAEAAARIRRRHLKAWNPAMWDLYERYQSHARWRKEAERRRAYDEIEAVERRGLSFLSMIKHSVLGTDFRAKVPHNNPMDSDRFTLPHKAAAPIPEASETAGVATDGRSDDKVKYRAGRTVSRHRSVDARASPRARARP